MVLDYRNLPQPSTFTHLTREVGPLIHVKNIRQAAGIAINNVVVLGSGPIEPFTTASLLPNANVTAVDNSKESAELIGRLQRGDIVTWADFAEHCNNPGSQINRDFLPPRIGTYISYLRQLQPDGLVLTDAGLSVDEALRRRVSFIGEDALAFSAYPPVKPADLVMANFLGVNMDRALPGSSNTLMGQTTSNLLTPDGHLIIGDTGAHLGTTLRQLEGYMADGGNEKSLKACLTHMARLAPDKIVTSHAVIIGPRTQTQTDVDRENLAIVDALDQPNMLRDEFLKVAGVTLAEAAELHENGLALAITGPDDNGEFTVLSAKSKIGDIKGFAPEPGREWSKPIIPGLAPVKPFLTKDGDFPE